MSLESAGQQPLPHVQAGPRSLFSLVMAGLDPAIHVALQESSNAVDPRIKSGDDGYFALAKVVGLTKPCGDTAATPNE